MASCAFVTINILLVVPSERRDAINEFTVSMGICPGASSNFGGISEFEGSIRLGVSVTWRPKFASAYTICTSDSETVEFPRKLLRRDRLQTQCSHCYPVSPKTFSQKWDSRWESWRRQPDHFGTWLQYVHPTVSCKHAADCTRGDPELLLTIHSSSASTDTTFDRKVRHKRYFWQPLACMWCDYQQYLSSARLYRSQNA